MPWAERSRSSSQPGRGTAFRITAALEPAPVAPDTVPQQAVASPDCPGLSILMVEDNAINRLVAREMLRRQGCEVTEAEDGLAGVAAPNSAGST